VLPLGSLALTVLALWICGLIHPILGFALQVFWCWQALAMRGLRDESLNVYKTLRDGSLSDARMAVSRIVGRNTQNLDAAGVIKAAVETVAENFSDGVVAPAFYMLLGGAPLALWYKAINTMDSMVGYKNDRYLFFGRAAAKLDDAVNFIPSRLAALFLIASAQITGQDARKAWKIWRRDRHNHASPNSAQTEAVMAGALGVQLAGPAYYFGKRYDKPTIGDALRPVEPEDIQRANRMLYVAGTLCLMCFIGLRVGLCFWIGW
uniref:adenosylcobinamide-phosphate synthase CbiB n=1 Tax=uncultured Ruthenibacterium sp. TaxID=1905347 RepID=UPI00349E94EA